jgi:hypothetical protein
MKCKELKITVAGESEKTVVEVDGKVVENIQRVELFSDASSKFVQVHVYKNIHDFQGKLKTRPLKVRDPNTQKFVEVQEPVLEPLQIEFEKE